MIFPTATALVGLTILTCHVARKAFGILHILHLRAVVSPVATAMEPPLQNKAPEDHGHVAAVGNLFLLPLPARAELRQKHCPILDALTITSLFCLTA